MQNRGQHIKQAGPLVCSIIGRDGFRFQQIVRRGGRDSGAGDAVHGAGSRPVQIGDVEMPVRANLGRYTQPISFVGVPVVTAPVPLTPLPIGVQIIIAAPWREDVALRIAHALEGRRRGRSAPPH